MVDFALELVLIGFYSLDNELYALKKINGLKSILKGRFLKEKEKKFKNVKIYEKDRNC